MGEAALPERLPLPLFAAVKRAGMANSVCPGLAPAHARPLLPLPHHRLAGTLHHPAADLPALGLVLRVLHPPQVVLEVALHLAPLLSQRRRRPGWPLPVAQHR